MAGMSLTAVQRLTMSRQRLVQVLNAPAPPPLSAQVQALLSPAIQRHPWRWALGALASGGALAASWHRLPKGTQAALVNVAQALGQEALLTWWLDALANSAASASATEGMAAAATGTGSPTPP